MDSPPYSPVWGWVFRHVNLLVPPKHPDAQMGWIIMEPEDTPPMSGSNSICVATVLLETGTHQHMLDPQDPWPQGYQVADTWPKI